MSKVASVIRGRGGQTPFDQPDLGQRGNATRPVKEIRRETRSCEEILRAEYDAAQSEFDLAKENPHIDPDMNSCKGYVKAIERLRKFLAYGEVPVDVLEKLNAEESKQKIN